MPRSNERANSRFYFADDVAQMLNFSQRKAYDIIKKLNAELEAAGKMTFDGRVPKNYFDARCNVTVIEEIKSGKVIKSVV